MSQAKAQWIKENLKAGEIYAGIILGKDGAPDQHLILLPGQANDITFAQAGKWAKKAGGELPTRREQSLLFANCKELFDQRAYWSCEQYSADPAFAWSQGFGIGTQSLTRKGNALRARAVRRLIIE